jgi:hypothetical protein
MKEQKIKLNPLRKFTPDEIRSLLEEKLAYGNEAELKTFYEELVESNPLLKIEGIERSQVSSNPLFHIIQDHFIELINNCKAFAKEKKDICLKYLEKIESEAMVGNPYYFKDFEWYREEEEFCVFYESEKIGPEHLRAINLLTYKSSSIVINIVPIFGKNRIQFLYKGSKADWIVLDDLDPSSELPF